jgi:peptidyl-prolyl cis-trans isomerase B (cyclophilin B)
MPRKLIALSTILLLLFGCASKKAEKKDAPPPKTETEQPAQTENQTPTQPKPVSNTVPEIATIETRLGNIVVEFFPDVAPNHVANFIKLAKEGFYNGTTFHRVIPGFVIQGGDPNTKDKDRSNDGMGGPGYSINAEFNSKPHLRGTLSMARSQDPNSAGSQFYICLASLPSLDGKYTVFGQTISGMEVADKIAALKRDQNDNPLESVTMKVVISPKPEKK